MTRARAYIQDGYNEEAYIKEVNGVHEAVTFTFRPMLPGQVREITKGFSDLPAESQSIVICTCLDKHLVKWDILDDSGSPLPVSPKSISSIKKLLQDRLFDIVTGYSGGDPRPESNNLDDSFDARNLLERAKVVDKKPDIAVEAKN